MIAKSDSSLLISVCIFALILFFILCDRIVMADSAYMLFLCSFGIFTFLHFVFSLTRWKNKSIVSLFIDSKPWARYLFIFLLILFAILINTSGTALNGVPYFRDGEYIIKNHGEIISKINKDQYIRYWHQFGVQLLLGMFLIISFGQMILTQKSRNFK